MAEFHYLHHQPDGTPYDDPNAMGDALRRPPPRPGSGSRCWTPATSAAGSGRRPRACSCATATATAEPWADARRRRPGARSTRCARCRATSCTSFRGRAPLHVHLSEQVAENEACLAAYGVTPTRLLHEAGLLGPRTTVVHATHLTDDDIALLGSTGTNVCISPTTERDLADGIGPARRWPRRAAGSRSAATATRSSTCSRRCAASRWTSGWRPSERGHWSAAELLARSAPVEPDRGRRARADLVTLDTTSPRTAGTGADENTAVFAATARRRHARRRRRRVGSTRRADDEAIGRELDAAIGALWPRP